MSVKKECLYITGMTCINCQNKIEKALSKMPGVSKASVSYKDGTANVTYDPDRVSHEKLVERIRALDYDVTEDKEQGDLVRQISLIVIIISLYVVAERLGILSKLVPSQLAENGMGYGMLFLTGVLTSLHCIAMCGGIGLSQSIPAADSEGERKYSLRPSILYNAGRVISYTLTGFVLGLVGMLIGGAGHGVPVLFQGALKIFAGVVMVIMGLNMLSLFPSLRRFTVHMPKKLAGAVGKKKRGEKRPLVVGLLNGLMPCGPLQSMQILALASGSPVAGALSMLMFSLGTVPLMLGLGTLVTALGKKFSRVVTGAGAVLVSVLGLSMISQGGSLSGMLDSQTILFVVIALAVLGIAVSIPVPKKIYRGALVVASLAVIAGSGWLLNGVLKDDSQEGGKSSVEMADGVQMVNSTLAPGAYPDIMVKAGIPVKWNIYAPEGSINGCNYRVIIQEYGIEHTFEEGDNVIEFTPEGTGEISYTCWMGMIHGNITVTA